MMNDFKLQVEIRSWAVQKAWISSGLTEVTGSGWVSGLVKCYHPKRLMYLFFVIRNGCCSHSWWWIPEWWIGGNGWSMLKTRCTYCLSNQQFDRLGDPLDEIVTISVHKYSFIMPRRNVTWWRHLIRCQDVGYFIFTWDWPCFSFRWFHLAVVWDRYVMRVYLDGEAKKTIEPGQYWDQTPATSWVYLARCNEPSGGRYGAFYIDEWFYWNNVLSDKSIQKVYSLDK